MARTKPCPLCGNAPSPEYKPFCSRGCRDRDMLKWLGEGYTIPVEANEDTDNRDAAYNGGLDSAEKPD
ncbi:DNA gyrase inhibitor YacG [Sphingomonas populi]|uniref:DNA gyrase inhibitor YacG n=2 Tax=Sphingomonas populi TaxID=2484750 RepID=A0A4Q6XWX8_9SPHN|nr:DNA gyrase inhibitor YacG [Sphingomonas populi]RZF60986.1 DNA gyrase inhibitor YacG [Sphingomonas populi]